VELFFVFDGISRRAGQLSQRRAVTQDRSNAMIPALASSLELQEKARGVRKMRRNRGLFVLAVLAAMQLATAVSAHAGVVWGN
jgi:hypothetical protein